MTEFQPVALIPYVTYPYNLLKCICKKNYSQINKAWVTLSHSFLSLNVFCNSPSTTNIHFCNKHSLPKILLYNAIANCRNDNHYIFLPFRNSTSVVRIADCGTIWLFTISSAFYNADCGLQKALNFFTFNFHFLLSTMQISDCRNPLYIIYILTLFLLP